MKELACLFCNCEYFQEGYYELDISVDVDLYGNNREGFCEATVSTKELEFKLKENSRSIDSYESVYKYVCQDCGYIMSFAKEQQVKTRKQEGDKAKTYDWSNFNRKQ